MSKIVLGLTGGIASGKSTAANILAALGAEVIDTDTIARQLTVPGSPLLAQIFLKLGRQYRQADGSLNRRLLREAIIVDLGIKSWLEQLLHPAIRAKVKLYLAQSRAAVLVVMIPLLTERSGYPLDVVWTIETTSEQQLACLCRRDGMGDRRAQQLIKLQPSVKERRRISDRVIQNTGDAGALTAQLVKLWWQLPGHHY